MKPLIMFVAFLFFAGVAAEAQVVNIPKKAKEHFAKKYPDATEVDWNNNLANYEVKFKTNDGTQRAYYHVDGNWDFTELYIDKAKIPETVSASVAKSRFAEHSIESTAVIENNKGEILYRLEMKKGLDKKFVFYDKTGKEIKTAPTT